MKRAFPGLLLVVCFGLPLLSSAQRTIDKRLSVHAIDRLLIQSKYANLSIEPWDGPEIRILGTAAINNGRNDEAFQLITEVHNGQLTVVSFLENEEDLPRYAIAEHDGQRYYLDGDDPNAFERLKKTHGQQGWNLMGNSLMVDVELRIRVPRDLALELQSTYGDLNLANWSQSVRGQTTYGQVTATLIRLPANSEVWLRSEYKLIDIAIRPSTQLTVDIESDYGAIFTDLPIEVNTEQSESKAYSDRIVGALNGGGSARLRVVANYGNIYLREG